VRATVFPIVWAIVTSRAPAPASHHRDCPDYSNTCDTRRDRSFLSAIGLGDVTDAMIGAEVAAPGVSQGVPQNGRVTAEPADVQLVHIASRGGMSCRKAGATAK
jgi:hypothetical protein